MGEAEFKISGRQLIIHSNIIVYGNAADEKVTASIREEVETMWNEPMALVNIKGALFTVTFNITATLQNNISPIEIYSNTDGRNNYFRVEEYSNFNISFVDGIGCNTGYFFIENLYKGSTTAAHEYGHTIGLDHPDELDIRGKGRPGIMYPRGTLVDAEFQYDPKIPAGLTGGTMHPMYRKVTQNDIGNLKLDKQKYKNGIAVLGEFTNVYHKDHSALQ